MSAGQKLHYVIRIATSVVIGDRQGHRAFNAPVGHTVTVSLHRVLPVALNASPQHQAIDVGEYLDQNPGFTEKIESITNKFFEFVMERVRRHHL